MYVNGKQIPNEGLSLAMDHENNSVMGYGTLLVGSGVHHSNSGLQITYDMYIAGYFMLFFDLTADHAASQGHTTHPDKSNIRIELKFAEYLPDAFTCLLNLEYGNSVGIDYCRTDFIDLF
jgi:hypothetical protein